MKKLLGLFLTMAMVVSLTACGKKQAENDGESLPAEGSTTEDASYDESATDYGVGVTMAEIKEALVSSFGEDYWPNTEIPEDMLKDIYGVSADMYEEYFGEIPMISTNVDTVLIVKAKEGQMEAVEDALNTYRDAMVSDTMQYPMNVGKIQASRIESFGQYVCFVQLGADTMDALENGDDAVIEQCQQANEQALEVIQNTLAKNQ